jgi:cobalt-zinc-cadmium efflux system outer membrane protein
MLATGCASTDPTPDLDGAASSVEAIGGVRPTWSATTPFEPLEASAWPASTPAERLSAERAVALALERNPTMRGQLAAIAAARAALAQSETPPNPMVGFAYGAPIDGGAGSMLTASVMMQLRWLWERPAAVEAAEARLRAATLRAADTALTIIAEVRLAHAALVAAERERDAMDEALIAARELEALIAERWGAGIASAVERRAAIERRTEVERAATLADLDAKRAKLALLERIALSDAELGWSSDGRWPELSDAVGALASAPSAARVDLGVAALAAEVVAADADARLAGLRGLPELEVGAMFERSMEGDETLGPSLNASLPIFDRGDASTAAAAATRAEARWELERAIHAVRTEARVAAEAWIAAERAWRVGSAEQLALAIADRDAAIAAHRSGLADRVATLEAIIVVAERSAREARDHLSVVTAAIAFERRAGVAWRDPATRAADLTSGPTAPLASSHQEARR